MNTRIDWSAVDFRNPNWVISEKLGCSSVTVSRQRTKHKLGTVRKTRQMIEMLRECKTGKLIDQVVAERYDKQPQRWYWKRKLREQILHGALAHI